MNARCFETLSEPERVRCMAEQGNGRGMSGMDDHGSQPLPVTTQSSQFVVCSPPPFPPPRSAPMKEEGASDRPTAVGLTRPGIKRSLNWNVSHLPPAKQPFGGPDPGRHGTTQTNALASGNNGRPILLPTNAQVGEVVVKKPNPPNMSVLYCDPRNQVRYPIPYMFPPPCRYSSARNVDSELCE